MIAASLLAGALGVGMLTYDMVRAVSDRANHEDRERTREVVKTALGAAQDQLAGMVIDHSLWDDAVEALYGTPDLEWTIQSFEPGTNVGTNYNVVMVVDRTLPVAVVGLNSGVPFRPTVNDYFFGKLNFLLDELPQDTITSDIKSSILDTADGLALVAVGPILPGTANKVIPAKKSRYLVMLRFLRPSVVSAIGRQYVIDDFRLASVGTQKPSGEIIRDLTGAAVADAQWTDRRPGDIAGNAVGIKVLWVLAFLFGMLTIIAIELLILFRTIREREAAAQYRAMHDVLTDLPNRAALRTEIARLAVPGSAEMVLAFADLDGFKEVNDTFDHATGDRLIQAVAAELIQLSKGRCSVYRLGGDEFVMLFSGPDAQQVAAACASEFISSLARPFNFEGRIATVGVSIGIAGNAHEKIDGSELMRRADIAMYWAKSSGRNRYCLFEEEQGEKVSRIAKSRPLQPAAA